MQIKKSLPQCGRDFFIAPLVKGDSPVRGDVLEEDRGVCRLRLSKEGHIA